MNIVINWLISALVIVVGSYVLPGVHVDTFVTALLVALVLGILNVFLKPLLVLLTLPVTVLTLGIFMVVINAFLILLTDTIIGGFMVDGFWWAVLFSIVISLINLLIGRLQDH